MGCKKHIQYHFGSKLRVKDGDMIEAGEPLTEGSINPNEILLIKGPEGVINT